MKAHDLAELLLRTPDAEVFAWDADAEGWFPISGIVGDHAKIEVQTDDTTD